MDKREETGWLLLWAAVCLWWCGAVTCGEERTRQGEIKSAGAGSTQARTPFHHSRLHYSSFLLVFTEYLEHALPHFSVAGCLGGLAPLLTTLVL